jgi:hypothetical protein
MRGWPRSSMTLGAGGASANEAAAAALMRAFWARYTAFTPSGVSSALCCLERFSLDS